MTHEFAEVLRGYGISAITGDKYAAGWVRERFQAEGIVYQPSEQSKSELYAAFVPIVMSRRVQLLDDKVVVAQFLNLVRKVGRGTAREIIDHRVGWRDDVANACAAACVRAAVPADSGEIVAVNLGRSRSRGKVDWRGLDPSLPISGGRWSITRLT